MKLIPQKQVHRVKVMVSRRFIFPKKIRQLVDFVVRWTDKSDVAFKKWQLICNILKSGLERRSASLSDLMQCEGSCGGFHNCRKLTIESKSGRKICQSCCRQAEGLYDIRPMKTDDTSSFSGMSTNNNRYEEFRPEATTSATARETEKNLAHNYIVPTELLQIRVVILEKAHHIIVRRKLEIELPSDFLIKHILDVIEDCISDFDGIQIYYSTKPIRSKKSLNPLKISAEQKTRLKSIANGRSLINFIVATKGVCVLKSDLNKRETKPVMTSSVR